METMIKVFEAFSGIGSQRMALKNIGIDHEVVAISEIDKHAIKAYEELHGETLNLGDISLVNVDDIPSHDLFTYSFPCQDISLAGGLNGFDKDSGTRSSLLWECQRIIEEKRPKYLLLENVKNLVSKRYIDDFNVWIDTLSSLGYTTTWKVINSKYYGVPQGRERVFAVSILGDKKFEFPNVQNPIGKIKDILECTVDEKYYADEYTRNYVMKQVDYIPPSEHFGILSYATKFPTLSRVYEVDDTTLPKLLKQHKKSSKVTTQMIADEFNISKSKADHWFRSGKYFVAPDSEYWYDLKEMLGFNNNDYDTQIMEYKYEDVKYAHLNRVYDINGVAPTLTTKIVPYILLEKDIRTLTPKEYWRLMGFNEEDYSKFESLPYKDYIKYKLLGNSIVVPVLENIFKEMFKV